MPRDPPELTQAAYRIGDSVANIITPLMSYIVILVTFVQKYGPKAGIGTVIALMLPYTVAFYLAWAGLLVPWMLLGWPMGRGPRSSWTRPAVAPGTARNGMSRSRQGRVEQPGFRGDGGRPWRASSQLGDWLRR